MTNYQKLNGVSEIESRQNERFITVAGKRFHYTWLRDNCLCSKCRHAGSWEKLNDISKHSLPPEPLFVEQTDEQLIIDWNESPTHRSIFPRAWLLSHAYDRQSDAIDDLVFLWNQTSLETKSVQKYDPKLDKFESWSEQLFKLGFVVLHQIQLEDLEAFLLSLGPVRNTEYGTIITQNTSLAQRDIAATNNALTPHTDLSFWYNHQVAEFLYCVANEATGGESLVVDGFRVAQDFRQNHPDCFDILTETPVRFCRVEPEYQYFFRPTYPIIELSREGEIAAVRFSQKNCTPILPFEEIEGFYKSYTIFSRYLKNLDYQYRFRLEPGDCLLMQNFRILHGRTAFDPSSGTREFRVGYIEWDYFLARYFYQREFRSIIQAGSTITGKNQSNTYITEFFPVI